MGGEQRKDRKKSAGKGESQERERMCCKALKSKG